MVFQTLVANSDVVYTHTHDGWQLPCNVGEMRRDLVVISPSKLLQHYQNPTVLSVDSLTKFVVLDVTYYQPSGNGSSSSKKKATAAGIDSITEGDGKSVSGEISLAEIEVGHVYICSVLLVVYNILSIPYGNTDSSTCLSIYLLYISTYLPTYVPTSTM